MLNEKIERAIEGALASNGYDVARVIIRGGARTVVEIDIDRLDDAPVTIDDCVSANRLISAILDVEDFIENSYTLEVSSPGENRPLTKIRDFERFCGKNVKLELHEPVDAKRKLVGVLSRVDVDGENATIYIQDEDSNESAVSFANIKKANVKRVF